MASLQCSNLSLTYGTAGGKTKAVQSINYHFNSGIFYSIIGKSGAGKTSVLKLISGLTAPTEGNVTLDGTDIHRLPESEIAAMRRRRFGFVFQNYRLLPELTIEENIMLPQILDKRDDQAWREQLMEKLGLISIKDHLPYQSSGGEQQRCAIARALINRPDFIFADEPTGNLDKRTSWDVLQLLLSMQKENKVALILVTHDLEVARCADVLIHMEDGRFIQETEVLDP